jgi:LacI family transcriptional regulator
MGAERRCQGACITAYAHGGRDHPHALASELWHPYRGAPARSRQGQLHAATRLAEHLLGLGHHDFGMVAHETEANDRIQQRIEGFNSALARAGIAIRPQHFVRADSRFIASGRDGMRRVLQASGPHPTAVVCTNDYIATGAIIEAKELGFAVPDDLSIAGFDDTDMAVHLDPPLTTIRVPSRLMGRELAKYIVALLETKTAECPPPLDAEMIIRRSTAPPRQG